MQFEASKKTVLDMSFVELFESLTPEEKQLLVKRNGFKNAEEIKTLLAEPEHN